MNKFQYQVVDLKATSASSFSITHGREQLQATLDRMGAQGWELVCMQGTAGAQRLVFKRAG